MFNILGVKIMSSTSVFKNWRTVNGRVVSHANDLCNYIDYFLKIYFELFILYSGAYLYEYDLGKDQQQSNTWKGYMKSCVNGN